MAKYSKNEKDWAVISVIIFLIILVSVRAYTTGNGTLQEFYLISVILIFPLFIVWCIWWVIRD